MDPFDGLEPPPDGPDYEFSYEDGWNDHLDALRPLIAAAAELAHQVLVDDLYRPPAICDLAEQVRDLTTPKGDTP
jgi:hypothetical protein